MKTKKRALQQKSRAAAKPPRNKRIVKSPLVAVKGAASSAKARQAPGTKQAVLLALMRRKGGTTIDEAVTALGWQPHSVRGLISGVARKKLGLSVQTNRDDKGRLQYRIG